MGDDSFNLVDIIHLDCGMIAFRYTEFPQRGDVIDPAKARLLDGTTPTAGQMMRCSSCDEVMAPGAFEPVGSRWHKTSTW